MWVGPLCHGARAEVAAAAGKPPVHRWSPPLVRLPGASFQRDPVGAE
jgi:hypothetical protein